MARGGGGGGAGEIAPRSMQRAAPAGGGPGGPGGGGPIVGPGPLGLQGPARSIKISPVKIQDESGDPMSQSE